MTTINFKQTFGSAAFYQLVYRIYKSTYFYCPCIKTAYFRAEYYISMNADLSKLK